MAESVLDNMQNNVDKGGLRISLTAELSAIPVKNAKILISYTGNPDSPLEELTTDSSGQTETIEVAAPPLEYSMTPGGNQPYSEYNIKVTAPGYESVNISGAEVLSGQTAIQNVQMKPEISGEQPSLYVIPPHTLYGDYPPKIAEAEIKPVNESGEIVLSKVVVPEYVVVHDGPPTDSSAKNYYVRFKDYIKNVASSEIYATWPDSTIRANILAILSFTMNRVYTEWYRSHPFSWINLLFLKKSSCRMPEAGKRFNAVCR